MWDNCDYCGAEATTIRAIGFTEHEGREVPLVTIWCGECTPDDTLDDRAVAALLDLVKEAADD